MSFHRFWYHLRKVAARADACDEAAYYDAEFPGYYAAVTESLDDGSWTVTRLIDPHGLTIPLPRWDDPNRPNWLPVYMYDWTGYGGPPIVFA